MIYNRLNDGGYIKKRTISQLFDQEKGIFLPDRFVTGTCPRCKAEDQNGDSCDVCGATYSPTELESPKSVMSGSTPVLKDSEHYFFDLPAFEGMLKTWLTSGAIQGEMANQQQLQQQAGSAVVDTAAQAAQQDLMETGGANIQPAMEEMGMM